MNLVDLLQIELREIELQRKLLDVREKEIREAVEAIISDIAKGGGN